LNGNSYLKYNQTIANNVLYNSLFLLTLERCTWRISKPIKLGGNNFG